MGLTKILQEIKKFPVSVEFIRDRLPPKCRVVEYQHLKGKSRHVVFRKTKTEALVVLIPKKDEDIGHFIVLIPGKKSIEYFSSLGNSWMKELALLEEPKAIFNKLLGKNFNYNQRRLQSGAYSVNDCGLWVLLRVYFRHLKLREFQALFSRRITLESTDDLAALMGVVLFQDR